MPVKTLELEKNVKRYTKCYLDILKYFGGMVRSNQIFSCSLYHSI